MNERSTRCNDCGHLEVEHGRTEVLPDGRLRRVLAGRLQAQSPPGPPVCVEYQRTYPVMGVL